MHFLTDVDPKERVKGSRDPLGTLSVWSRFARLVVGGLTSQTVSLDDFRILVVGSWLLDQLPDDVPPASAFLVWEQLASYARYGVAEQEGFRGITRARERYERSVQRRETLSVSAARADQTLSNQAGYGIWGLYRSTAWATGLLAQERPYVRQPEVESLVRSLYRPRLEIGWGAGAVSLLKALPRGTGLRPWRQDDRDRLKTIATTVTLELTREERQLYRDFLLRAGPDDLGSVAPDVRRRQRNLYPLLQGPAVSQGVTHSTLGAVAASADADLAEALRDIEAAGSMLDAAVRCFVHITHQGDTSLMAESQRLEDHFADLPHLLPATGLRRLRRVAASMPRLLGAPGDGPKAPSRWLRIAETLHTKDFAALIGLLIEQNEAVTRAKGGGAAWVGMTASGAIRSTVMSPGSGLPDMSSFTGFGQTPLYLPNLLSIARDVAATPARS